MDTEIHRALSVWSNVTELRFQQRRSGPVHIDVRFEDGEHGDGDPFDGVGGTLAHAYFPVFGGAACFAAAPWPRAMTWKGIYGPDWGRRRC